MRTRRSKQSRDTRGKYNLRIGQTYSQVNCCAAIRLITKRTRKPFPQEYVKCPKSITRFMISQSLGETHFHLWVTPRPNGRSCSSNHEPTSTFLTFHPSDSCWLVHSRWRSRACLRHECQFQFELVLFILFSLFTNIIARVRVFSCVRVYYISEINRTVTRT